MSEFKKLIQFEKAFDKRDPDPRKNYGIHGVILRFVLIGDKGAVHFVLYTNWQTTGVRKEKENDLCGDFCFNKPLPADVGYHSPRPAHKYQDISREDCEYIGKPCYTGGSGLYAEKGFDALTDGGEEGLWEFLTNYYHSTFEEGGES